MATADFNNDGKADIVYEDSFEGGSLHILLGNGDGTFTPAKAIALPDAVGTVISIGDLNKDGIPDIVLGYYGHANFRSGVPYASNCISTLIGNGDGTFQALIENPIVSAGSPVDLTSHMAIADFDGDGMPDLVYSDDENTYLMRGDGTGHLTQRLPAIADTLFESDIVTADLNGDGRPDAVVAGGPIIVLLNTGGGTFAAPVIYTTPQYSPQSHTVVLADFNSDGHPDLLYFGTADLPATNILYRPGNVDGTFGTETAIGSYLGPTSAFAGVVDVNSDGRPDVLTAGNSGLSVSLSTPGTNTTLRAPQLYATSGFLYTQSVTADFNGDGLPDVLLPSNNSLTLLIGNADGTFQAASAYQTKNSVGGLVVADTNGDKILDVIAGEPTGYPEVFLGGSDGSLLLPSTGKGSGATDSSSYPIFAGNFNGDSFVDLFTWNFAQLGNGDGTFGTDIQIPLSVPGQPFWNGYWTVADLNGDGLTDVAAAWGNGVAIATSTAPGKYAGSSVLLSGQTGPVGVGDFNGDGCKDIVVTTPSAINLFLSDCHGNYTPSASYPTGFSGSDSTTLPGDLDIADLDGDHHLDLVVTIPGQSLVEIFYGRGDGSFVAAPNLKTSQSNTFITLGDLDGDGRPDLVLDGLHIVTTIHTLANRQFGPESFFAANEDTGKAVIADINGDGNVDIAVPNLGFLPPDVATNFSSFVILQAPLRVNASVTVAPEPSFPQQGFTATAVFSPAVGSAAPSGNVTFTVDGTPSNATLTAGRATLTSAPLSLGKHTITATFAGDFGFAPATATATHVIAELPTVTTLTSSANPQYLGQSVAITATVASAISGFAGGPFTGTITFSDNSSVIATASVNSNGSATTTTQTLALGSHTITAAYSGDTNNLSSTSAPLTETILRPDFSLSITPASVSVVSGQQTTFALTAVSKGGFSDNLTITFSGLPQYTTSSSPASFPLSANAMAAANLSINTELTTTAVLNPVDSSHTLTIIAATTAAFFLLPLSRRRRTPTLMVLAITTSLLIGLAGCGGKSSKPPQPPTPSTSKTSPGTYNIEVTVTGSQTGVAHSLVVPLTVTN